MFAILKKSQFNSGSKYFKLVHFFKPVSFFQTSLIFFVFFCFLFFVFLPNQKVIFLVWGCTHGVKKKVGAWLLGVKRIWLENNSKMSLFFFHPLYSYLFPYNPPLVPRYPPNRVLCSPPMKTHHFYIKNPECLELHQWMPQNLIFELSRKR